jgi:hypothetical protein
VSPTGAQKSPQGESRRSRGDHAVRGRALIRSGLHEIAAHRLLDPEDVTPVTSLSRRALKDAIRLASRVKAFPRAINHLDTRLYPEGRQLADAASNSTASSSTRASGSGAGSSAEASADREARTWQRWAFTLNHTLPKTLLNEIEWWRTHRDTEGWRGALQARAKIWARRGFVQGVEWTAKSMGWKLRGRVGEVTWREFSEDRHAASTAGYYEVDVTRASAGAVLDAVELMLRRQLTEVFDLRVDTVNVERAELQFHGVHGAGDDDELTSGLRLGALLAADRLNPGSVIAEDDRTWRVTLPWSEAEREELRRQLWVELGRSAKGRVRSQVTAHVFEIAAGEQVARRIADVELNLVLMSGSAQRVLGPSAQ